VTFCEGGDIYCIVWTARSGSAIGVNLNLPVLCCGCGRVRVSGSVCMFVCMYIYIYIYIYIYMCVCARALQIGRSLVRSQLVSLEFFIDINSFRSHYGPGVDSASNRKEY